jgi:hypothetical protein
MEALNSLSKYLCLVSEFFNFFIYIYFFLLDKTGILKRVYSPWRPATGYSMYQISYKRP